MDDSPAVLVVGGFLTSPVGYWRMRRRLLARGASTVVIAPIWTPDWLATGLVGLGRLVTRTRKAIERSYTAAGDTPIILIGHSAGGVLARIAMAPAPFEGRRTGAAEMVGALVTLGTPHRLAEASHAHRATRAAHAFLDAVAPGSFHAPTTGYLTVASRFVQGLEGRGGLALRRRSAGALYALLLGEEARIGWGDSLVPVDASHLDGARQMTLEGIAHGQAIAAWYGDDPGLDGWWPAALEVWREALEARAADGTAAGEPLPQPALPSPAEPAAIDPAGRNR